MRPHGSQQQLEQRRRRAVELHSQGLGPSEIARRLGATPQSVCAWMRKFRKGGQAALAAKPVPGRPPKLTGRQRRALVACLLRGARASGFDTDLWTCPRVAQMIAQRYGEHYHVDAIPRLLAGLGFSPQRPERRAVERDEAAIRQWTERDWPRIRRLAGRIRAHLVFIDETGFLLHPLVRKTWAPIGQTPILRQRTRHHRRVSAIGALSISPHRRRLRWYLQFHLDRSIRQEQVIDFLRHLLRHLGGPLVVVWDRLASHRSDMLREWLRRRRGPRLHLEYLPGYAPELNPNEYGWSYLKNHRLANYCPADVDALHARVCEAAEETCGRNELLRSFLHATGLRLTRSR